MEAEIEPDTDLAFELARLLYKQCFSVSNPKLRAIFTGKIAAHTPDYIYGWTDKLSAKGKRLYERRLYGSYNTLHCHAEQGQAGLLRLQMLGDTTPDVDERNEYGVTALIAAAYFGNPECAAILLENGANVRACDRSGRTALHCAVWKGHAAVAELLLGYDAPAGATDKEGKTPLDLARENGHEEIVRLLSGDRSEGDENTSDSPQEEKGQLKS
ncbi:MAG: ankyrin repeat domain-containing protein [Candidatus Brocadiia bacterium]